ncbi:MAG TPA: DUF1684 domain-containing protein [Candidatus Acidoferrum sp.]|nr:DUF1684 domain-containing protein [Candidatus Acidoferrum sp.]
MRSRLRILRSVGIVALLAVISAAAFSEGSAWRNELLKWREDHAAKLQTPDGWLSLTGLDWLAEGDNPLGSAPDNKIHLAAGNPPHVAILRLSGETVTLIPPAGGFPKELLVGGAAAKEESLRTDPDEDKFNPHLAIGTLNMYVVRRGNRFALRIKDSHSPTLVHFQGLKWYPGNETYRVMAKWIPYTPPKTVMLATLVGTSYPQPVPGVAEFTLLGKRLCLEPVLEDPKVAQLFFILRDPTSSTATYPSCRFLYTGFPTNGLEKPGELVLDFNRLENPPCAFTPYATCPLPPHGNVLPIALPVGEKRYHN